VHIDSRAYEAWRLMPAQNVGPGGTLWNVPPQNYCWQMLLDLKFLYEMLYVGLKTQNSISAEAFSEPHCGSLHHSPILYSWWGEELAAPCPRTPPPPWPF